MSTARIFILLLVLFFISSEQGYGQADTTEKYIVKKGGQLFLKSGKGLQPLTANQQEEGAKVLANGSIQLANGSKVKLEEGQSLSLSKNNYGKLFTESDISQLEVNRAFMLELEKERVKQDLLVKTLANLEKKVDDVVSENKINDQKIKVLSEALEVQNDKITVLSKLSSAGKLSKEEKKQYDDKLDILNNKLTRLNDQLKSLNDTSAKQN